MSRRLQMAGAAVLLLAGAAGVGAARWGGAGSGYAGTVTVQREDFSVFVEATGKLEAAVNFEIGPPSARDFWEYNLTWMIPEGSQVNKGDVVARFDTTELDDRLREHRAALETTLQEREKEQRNLEVSLRQLALDLVKAEGEMKKVDLDLSVPDGLVSFIELEQTRQKKVLAERRAAFLREKIDFEKALVKSKLDLLDVKREFSEGKIAYNEGVKEKFSVRAPVSGMVVYVPKRNGDRWDVGESVWMLAKILKVADVSTLRVEASVLEVDAARIAPGQPAEISVDAVPGLTLSSRIAEIGRIVHERSVQDPSKVFDAYLPLGEVDADVLRPGMGVQVRVETERLPGRLTIPVGAVLAAADGMYVDLVGKTGRERRQVRLGARNQQRVVVDSGLEEGDVVALGLDLEPLVTAAAPRHAAELLLLAACCAGCGYLPFSDSDAADDAVAVTAERTTLNLLVPATGYLEATHASPVGVPRVPTGALKVKELIPEGSIVAPGEIILIFDDTQLNIELDNHRASFRSADLRIDGTQLRSAIESGGIEVMRQVAALELDNTVAFEIVDRTIYSQLEILETEVKKEEAQETILFAEASLLLRGEYYDIEQRILDVEKNQVGGKIGRVETSLGNLVLKAPIGGLVVYKKNWRGGSVGIGDSLWPGNVVMSIVDPATAALNAFVLEKDAAGLEVGAAATVTVDARAQREFQGVVGSVAELSRPIEQDSPVKYTEVRIDIKDGDPALLKPGMKGQAMISVGRITDTVVIPWSAVRGEPDARFVLVQGPGSSERREVRLGRGDLLRVSVEQGLEGGERVLVGRDPGSLDGTPPPGTSVAGPGVPSIGTGS